MTAAFPLIDLEGDARDRGRAYGCAAGERIARGLEIYRDDFERRGLRWDSALAAARRYVPALERSDPELAAEVAAIAEGAEQPHAAIVLLNARTELTLGGKPHDTAEECTAALALPETTADGHLLHGQNWDWRPDCAETAVILRIAQPEGPQLLTFCEAGQLARHGMNAAGVALTANGLQVPADSEGGGIPTPILRRRLLMQASLAAAAGVVMNAARSCSHALIISQRAGEAYCLEVTPRRVYWLLPEHGLLTHANHFKSEAALQQVEDLSLLRHPESLYRDRRAQAALAAERGNVGIGTLEKIFADDYGAPSAICRSPAPRADGAVSATVATLIMDTTAARMRIAPSPYRGVEFTEYRFA